MENHNKIVGQLGEKKAKFYLIKKGYKILDCNYRYRYGEIDIIAKKDGVTVFVEVKTRSDEKYGRPSEAVNYFKRRNITAVSQMYLLKHNLDTVCRFDVIEVMLKKTFLGYSAKINHIENAFGE